MSTRKFIQLVNGTATLSTSEPNYLIKCIYCGQTPTVDIYNVSIGETSHSNQCGACFFGEADCLDVENW